MERLTKRAGYFFGGDWSENVLVRGKRLGPAYFQIERDYKDYSDALEKLARYEDAEEAGRLIELPCKIGDAVFLVERRNILEEKVLGFIVTEPCLIMNTTYRDYVARPKCENIGKLLDDDHLSVFLAREDAEAALIKQDTRT